MVTNENHPLVSANEHCIPLPQKPPSASKLLQMFIVWKSFYIDIEVTLEFFFFFFFFFFLYDQIQTDSIPMQTNSISMNL